MPTEAQPKSWFRRLAGERMEIMLRDDENGVKLRASGAESEMFGLVEWFEDLTGKRVSSPTWRRPPRRGPRPIPGQVELDDVGEPLAMQELSSDDTLPAE